MDDSTRFRLQQLEGKDGLNAPAGPAIGERRPVPSAATPSPVRAAAVRDSAPFVGDAMRALFESGDVRISRGDETRVISKAHGDVLDALEDTAGAQSAADRSPDASQTSPTPAATERAPNASHSSAAPGPRVDMTLWVVLAGGLLAIVTWMLVHAR